MKKYSVILLISVAFLSVVAFCACGKLFSFKPKQFVPENYTITVDPGGEIEAEYPNRPQQPGYGGSDPTC